MAELTAAGLSILVAVVSCLLFTNIGECNGSATFSLDASSYTVAEGTSLTFDVCKSTGNNPGGFDVEVDISHVDTTDVDFDSFSQPAVSFTMTGNAASCSTQTIAIASDSETESDETFHLILSRADPGTVGSPQQATVTITGEAVTTTTAPTTQPTTTPIATTQPTTTAAATTQAVTTTTAPTTKPTTTPIATTTAAATTHI